jgi:hypothetical protein
LFAATRNAYEKITLCQWVDGGEGKNTELADRVVEAAKQIAYGSNRGRHCEQ